MKKILSLICITVACVSAHAQKEVKILELQSVLSLSESDVDKAMKKIDFEEVGRDKDANGEYIGYTNTGEEKYAECAVYFKDNKSFGITRYYGFSHKSLKDIEDYLKKNGYTFIEDYNFKSKWKNESKGYGLVIHYNDGSDFEVISASLWKE